MNASTTKSSKNIRLIPLILAPLLFVILSQSMLFNGLSQQGHTALGIAVWMAIWWLTEVVSISATALLPLILFPLFGSLSISDTSKAYAHPYVFLFLGGFLLALAIEKWSLHKRLALHIILWVGTAPRKLIFGFMLATAFLSMWISNTAATVMMLPIALAVIKHQNEKLQISLFGSILMISIAYSASIGGMATLIGSPPNLVLAGILKQNYQIDLSFSEWFLFAFPLSLLLLFCAWFYLTLKLKTSANLPTGNQEIKNELAALGKLSNEEKKIAVIFTLMAFLWTFRSLLLAQYIPNLDDSIIAIAGGLSLFVIPAGRKSSLLTWDDTSQLPWGILILFGGGMALANGFEKSQLTQWIGLQLSFVQSLPWWFVVLFIILSINFLTEITSNLATTAMLLPIIAAMSDSLNQHPYFLLFGTTLAASCAFMLPVATPPNAIVFASGLVNMKQMIKYGFWFNLLSVFILWILCYFILPLFIL